MKKDQVPRIGWCAAVILAVVNTDAAAQTSASAVAPPLRATHLEKTSFGSLQIAPEHLWISPLADGAPVTNLMTSDEWPAPDLARRADPPSRPAPTYDVNHWIMEQGLPANKIRALVQTQDGFLWVGTERGLARFDGVRFVSFTETNSSAFAETGQSVRSLFEDEAGRLWVGLGLPPTDDVSPKRRSFGETGPPLLLLPNWARFTMDAMGDVWSTSQGTTTEVLGCSSTTEAAVRVALDTREPHSVFADREGSVWVGSRDGLFRLKRRLFATFQMREQFGGLVQSVAVDHWDRLWFGTQTLCGRWSGRELLLLSNRNLPIGASVLAHQSLSENALASEPATLGVPPAGGFHAPPPAGGTPSAGSQPDSPAGGQVWANANDRGMFSLSDYYFNPRVPQTAAPLFPEVGEARVMIAARDGRTWIGSPEGLFVIKGASLTQVGRVEIRNVRSPLEDVRGALWIGTGRGEVFRVDAAGLYRLPSLEASALGAVLCFHESGDGTLWLGTENGLHRVKDGTLETFDSNAGMPGDAIDGILEDQFGRLWLGRKHGITRVARRDLEARLLDRSVLLEIAQFGRGDGILSPEPANGTPTCARTSDGRLWFARRRGDCLVDPSECPPGWPAPQVWIERPGTPHHHTVNEGEIRLPPGSGRHLELRFAATALHSPDRALVEYQLDGHDPLWRKAGRERKAIYSNLGPGRYRFRVRAENHEDRWSGAASPVICTITWAPVWRRFHLAETKQRRAGATMRQWRCRH